jgi:uncharacterized protein with GYD domain
VETVKHPDERQILDAIAGLDTRRRRRSLVLTALPLVAAIILVVVAGQAIRQLQDEQRQATAASAALEAQTTSLKRTMAEVGRQVTGVVEAISAIEALIESKQSYLRTIDEARFLIDVRMKFDAVHAALDAVSTAAPDLAKVRPWRRWVTVVKSAREPSELAIPSNRLECLESQKELIVFRTPNGMLALVILGDGSFTAAYRQTVRLRDAGCVPGAYFADTEKWTLVSDPRRGGGSRKE